MVVWFTARVSDGDLELRITSPARFAALATPSAMLALLRRTFIGRLRRECGAMWMG